MITIDIPGWKRLEIAALVLDYNGTLARDGALIPGVADRLRALSGSLNIHIITAATQGPVEADAFPFPVQVHGVPATEQALAKRALVEGMGAEAVTAIGNGRNDALMLGAAGLGLAVTGPEGAWSRTCAAADIVVRDILDGLDLLLLPKRLIATLRD